MDDGFKFTTSSAAFIEVVPTVVRDVPRLRDDVHNRHGRHIAFDLLGKSVIVEGQWKQFVIYCCRFIRSVKLAFAFVFRATSSVCSENF